jgi:hypothetical protein
MAVAANMASDMGSRPPAGIDARSPHLVFRNVLGAPTVAGLLDYVAAREKDFRPAIVRNRKLGELKVNRDLRDCTYLGDLGAFEAPIKTFVRNISAEAIARLGLIEPVVEPKEFEITAYRDGGRFGAHIDTSEKLNQVRVLSCVYYFAATPRRFSGGELRLYGFPTASGKDAAAPSFIDLVPETDTLVTFPSWLRHEVRPVRVPSGALADGRFTINCWIHRLSPPAGEVSGVP